MWLFKNLKIRTKIVLVSSFVAVLAVGINGYIGYDSAAKSLKVEAFNKLTAIREMKADQIEGYFQQIANQLLTFSADPTIIEALREFKTGFRSIETELGIDESEMDELSSRLRKYYEDVYVPELNKNLDDKLIFSDVWLQDSRSVLLQSLYADIPAVEGSDNPAVKFAYRNTSYNRAYQKYDPIIQLSLEEFTFYDVFLIDHESGTIVYSTSKGVDYGTSLLSGPYRTTNLAEAFRAVQALGSKKQSQMVDFAPYPPLYNAYASFLASPVYDGSHQVGVLIFQVPVDRINDIMTREKAWAQMGRGESEETYIVGQDYTLRNRSQFFIESYTDYFTMAQGMGVAEKTIEKIMNFNSTIGLQKVRTEGVDAALQGKTGTGIFVGYRGERVLSSYQPLAIPGVKWVIMSEVEETEALEPVWTLLNKMLLTFIASIGMIVILAVYFSRTITRPLYVLQENAKELSEGNLNVAIETGGHDEIGDLARNFMVMRNSINQLVGDLRVHGEQLEDRVAERTEELRQAREAAEEANLAKSRFLANMSHELRTPMNAIIGYSEMIMEESEDIDQLEFIPDLKRIQGAGKHLLALINDILDLSKIEAGRMELYLETFNVDQMLQEIKSTVSVLVAKRGNRLILDSSDSLGEMTTDLTKVRQSLLNLISNAAKFTEGGTVTLATQRKTIGRREWFEFQVIDSGIGIAENKLGILFDEFTQADDSTTRNYGGTGLGLAITKRFCEMLGGTISVESQPGEGATFTICLPAVSVSTADPEDIIAGVTEEAKLSVDRPTTQLSSLDPVLNKILAIDDNPDMLDISDQPSRPILVMEDDTTMREMLCRTLVKEGWEVREASNGKVGLEKIQREIPGMILLDLLMPIMDGFTFLTELRKEAAWRDIPVLVITSKDITREEKKLLEEQVVTVLQKGASTRQDLLEQVSSTIKYFVP